ncbi:MAG TPA: PstC family ABC transporter permease [Chitinophagaceae bacterium]|nr:PstC family ABC transporter permease [Chitinophagaceae bacterium]
MGKINTGKYTKHTYGQVRMENVFKRTLVAIAIVMIIIVVGIFLTLIVKSMPSIQSLGLKYLWGKTWDPINNVYGALPFLLGTLLTSFLALIISIPFSFAIAVYLGEYNPRGWLSNFLKNAVELIAAVPSVIYGFWALLVLVPIVQKMENSWNAHKFGEYKKVDTQYNTFSVNDKKLALDTDYFPLSYSGTSTLEGTIIPDNSTLPDSVKQGQMWMLDLKPMLEANKNKPSYNINDAITKIANDDFDKGAGGLILYNTSGIADNLQFNRKDTTTQLVVPVVYVKDDAYKKYFTAATDNSGSLQASVTTVDPYNILPYGIGIFTASLILSIMIIPYAASLGREMIKMVPSPLKEGAYALGATRYEVIRSVILPYTKSGLFAGILLSLGRALGETMAVTMVIGNTSHMPTSLFSPGNTMASVIANEFNEASHDLYWSALVELGLALFLVTVIINMIGKRIIKRFTNE